MRPARWFLRAVVLVAVLVVLMATAAFAQSPSPSPTGPPPPIAPPPVLKPGLCAPWHKCAAAGLLVTVGLYVLATAAMFAYQRRGFDSVEHKQGSPDGVPVKK